MPTRIRPRVEISDTVRTFTNHGFIVEGIRVAIERYIYLFENQNEERSRWQFRLFWKKPVNDGDVGRTLSLSSIDI